MIASLIALTLSTWTATPSADVWVYPNSSSPGGEPYLRAWGDGSKAVDATIPPGEAFSYSFIQFSLKDMPKGELKSAKLVLWNIKNDALTDDVIKAAPLEVHGLKGTFAEDTFNFEQTTCGPTDTLFGISKAVERSDAGIKYEFDLMDAKGEFKKALDAARANGTIGLALATKLSPADDRTFLYKVVSKEGTKAQWPTLSLEFGD